MLVPTEREILALSSHLEPHLCSQYCVALCSALRRASRAGATVSPGYINSFSTSCTPPPSPPLPPTLHRCPLPGSDEDRTAAMMMTETGDAGDTGGRKKGNQQNINGGGNASNLCAKSRLLSYTVRNGHYKGPS